MIYLSADDVIDIHHQIQPCALLDRGKLESAIGQPFLGMGDVEFYPTIFDKASCLLRGICHAHAFQDGNKRTAWTSTEVFLGANGIALGAIPDVDIRDFVVGVTVSSIDLGQAAVWLIDRSV